MRNHVVDEFEAHGFASVLALPLLSPAAATLVERKLAEITADSMLFLEDLKALTISTPTGSRRFHRTILKEATGPKRV